MQSDRSKQAGQWSVDRQSDRSNQAGQWSVEALPPPLITTGD